MENWRIKELKVIMNLIHKKRERQVGKEYSVSRLWELTTAYTAVQLFYLVPASFTTMPAIQYMFFKSNLFWDKHKNIFNWKMNHVVDYVVKYFAHIDRA